MNYKVTNEDQILDFSVRSRILNEIKSPENINRRNESYKRYRIYKDQIIEYVMKKLENEGLKQSTLALMRNRCSNISICKKIINKLARAYLGGVTRIVEDSLETTEQINKITKILDFDQKQKKLDRYSELNKNTMAYICPVINSFESKNGLNKYDIKLKALSSWQYDVIEDYSNPENAQIVILSDFFEMNYSPVMSATESESSRHVVSRSFLGTNKKDDVIADAPSDSGMGCKRTFIWWSDKYHFTTDEQGNIIDELSPSYDDDQKYLNPINMLPFVNVAKDQDGYFWAEGGEDISEGSILINTLITDMFSIAYMQGYGQLVVTGKNLPERLTMGPHSAMLFDYDTNQNEPKPEVTVVSANPPLDLWMKSIEQYVALLLSTNDLSPGSISTKLDATNFPSGIAMLVEMSDAHNNIEDKQEQFKDIERKEFEIIKRWQNLYYDLKSLSSKFEEIGKMPENFNLIIKFNRLRQTVSEKEKLENMKIRHELGISSKLDLIMMDNSDLTLDQAKDKLKEIEMDMNNNLKRLEQDDNEDNNRVENEVEK